MRLGEVMEVDSVDSNRSLWPGATTVCWMPRGERRGDAAVAPLARRVLRRSPQKSTQLSLLYRQVLRLQVAVHAAFDDVFVARF
jgi:hypothetical protein